MLVISWSSYANGVTRLKVGLLSPERPPYYFVNKQTGEISGLYVDLLAKATRTLPIRLEYKVLPQARLRGYMLDGTLDVEPGIAKGWRPKPLEVENSIYTKPFMVSEEVFVYWDQSWQPSERKKVNGCGVNGFDLNEKYFNASTHLLTTEYQLLQMIGLRRCDVAQMPKLVIDYWNNNSNAKLHYGKPIASYQLRLRLHKRHQHLLAGINSNIERLLQSGDINVMIDKYVNNTDAQPKRNQ